MLLRPEQRTKLDETNDLEFYSYPRLVTHVDEGFIDRLTNVNQYLQHPEGIFTEINRVLKPNGIVIVSFSNRMFYQKAIAAWRDGTERSRVELVKRYFLSVSGFTTPEVIVRPSTVPTFWQMLGMGSSDPFYAVIARKADIFP